MNRKYLFILISAFALLGILLIQVNWILKAAKLKEALFNEKAKIVLAKTSEAIGKNPAACRKIGEVASEIIPSNRSQFDEIDSLFNHYMAFYKIDMNYSYEIVSPEPEREGDKYNAERTFNQEFDINNLPKNIQLKLIFPDQNQFLLAEMGLPFFSSIGLILVVVFFFFLTIKSVVKEKEIAEKTSEFLNNMTHEFKTPLTNIGLATKMIERKLPSDTKTIISDYTEIIQFEKTKLSTQVDQVLGMANLEKGEIRLNTDILDINNLISCTTKAMELQLKDKGGNFNIKLNANRVLFNGDKHHLTSSICNLIDNAIKYSPSNPSITISTENLPSALELKIADKGIGIDKQEQPKVFEKYYRVQKGNIHDVKGFGIGLAYVKRIVELHSGEILLKSDLKLGTCFTIRLPYE